MPPEELQPGSVESWLRHAQSDFLLAQRNEQDDILLESLCFHAQQAVEKSFKALLLSFHHSLPRTHNIRILLDQLEPLICVPDFIEQTARLTDYAVMTRYPGDYEPVTTEEYRQAVKLTEEALNWVRQQLV